MIDDNLTPDETEKRHAFLGMLIGVQLVANGATLDEANGACANFLAGQFQTMHLGGLDFAKQVDNFVATIYQYRESYLKGEDLLLGKEPGLKEKVVQEVSNYLAEKKKRMS